MLISLLALFPAYAGFYVEGPSFESRAMATDFAKTAKEQGHKGRVVRRYQDSVGWEFIVRFDVDAEEEARTLGASLANGLELPAYVFDEKGNRIAVVEAGVAAPPPAALEADGTNTLDELAERHGAGRTVFSEADRVKFLFKRTMADGKIAQHVYARQGTDLYLAITPVEGSVKPSETVALGEAAWLTVDGKSTPQDLQRSRETIGRFGPESVIPMVLDLQALGEAHPELRDLTAKGTANVGGETCQVFGASDDVALLAIGPDGLVRRAAIGGDKRVLEYSGYIPVGEVLVPKTVRILIDGKLESTVEITEIELNADLDANWFAPRG